MDITERRQAEEAQKNPEAAEALKDAMNRLQSMEVLYDKLYRSEYLTTTRKNTCALL